MTQATSSMPVQLEGAFEADARKVLMFMGISLRRLIAQLPNKPQKAADVHKVLGVEASLGWMVYRLATATEPLNAGIYVPPMAAMNRVVRQSRQLGIDSKVLSDVEQSIAAFDRMIETHAGNREIFDSMIGDFSEDNSKDGVTQRRTLFRGNSHVFGLQAQCLFAGMVLNPSREDMTRLDLVNLAGRIGVRQIRRSSEVISETTVRLTQGSQQPSSPIQPLIPLGTNADAIGLIPSFCSQPLPRIEQYQNSDGYLCSRILSNGLGKQHELTYSSGIVIPKAMNSPTVDIPLTFVGRLMCPTEVVERSIIIHESAIDRCHAYIKAYSGLEAKDNLHLTDADMLPEQPEIAYLGRGIAACVSTDVPWFDKLVDLAMSTMGWNEQQFHVFRCRIEYPVVPSILRMFIAHGSDAAPPNVRIVKP